MLKGRLNVGVSAAYGGCCNRNGHHGSLGGDMDGCFAVTDATAS